MTKLVSRSLSLVAALFPLITGAARADWLLADLPFREYLGGAVTSLAPAVPSDLWAVSAYSYRYQDRDHARWNSLAYRSLNDGRLWDMPWDAPPGDPPPNSAPFQDTQLLAASFPERDTGFLFGWQRPTFALTDPPGPYAFYRTTDRGLTWKVTTLPNAEKIIPDEPDFALDALDATHVFAVQGRHVFETLDGVTWRERPGTFPRLFALQARGLPAPRVAGTDGGKAVAGTLTPNGFVADLTAEGTFCATHFADANHGWVAGGDAGAGTIYATVDGGKTWTRQFAPPGVLFRGIAAADGTHAWAVGERTGLTDEDADRGVIYGTADGGKTWTFERATPGRMVSVAFRGLYHGWAGGEDGVYRYVPPIPSLPGDIDRSGQTDSVDVAAILRRSGGLNVAAGDDLSAAGIRGAFDVASAVSALRGALALRAEPPASPGARAVVVYNSLASDANADGVGDSEEVARYYADRRGVPEDHLLPIQWADVSEFRNASAGRANWTDAFRAVVEPLRARLDALGRTSVDTIVFTYGVPYAFTISAPDGSLERITLDSAVQDPYGADPENWSSVNPYAAPFSGVTERYGRFAFDVGGRSMGQAEVGPDGAVSRGPYYLVGRVDGPGVEACKAMVDNALFAERHYGPGGYEGTAYIDNRADTLNLPTLQPYALPDLQAYAPVYEDYATYDKSIARTILTFEERGLPWRDEVTNASIGEAGAMYRDGTPANIAPRAMFYAGWYNYGRYYDVFEWLPGSVGIDFDSASAAYFREGRFFAGGALSAGLTSLVGVIDEPYSYHPKPDALMEYLARGFRLGEAAALANDTPRLSRALLLGDPLYRPFDGLPAEPIPGAAQNAGASAALPGCEAPAPR